MDCCHRRRWRSMLPAHDPRPFRLFSIQNERIDSVNSKKRLDSIRSWSDIENAQADGTVVEGKVTEENKGGVVVNIRGIRVFVPASQTDCPVRLP